MFAALRSALFVAWMAVTVVPYALVVLLSSIFLRGDTLYWICVAWLRAVIWGARVICGVRHRVHGMQHLPSADPGVIDISIGAPIPSTCREPGELMHEVEAWIETEMRRLDPEAYATAS